MPLPPSPAPAPLAESMYQDHQPWLLGWLRRKLGCQHRAEDVSQDTFLKLLNKPALTSQGDIRPLLVTIAKGLVVDHYRRQALEKAYLDALAVLGESHAPSPEARLATLESLIAIDKLLDGLPARVRSAFLLSQLDGLTYPQIADRLGVSVSSVQQYMTRALKACYLARYGGSGDSMP